MNRKYIITFTVEAEREADLPNAPDFLNGIHDGLPEAWFDMDEGDEFAITSMEVSAP